MTDRFPTPRHVLHPDLALLLSTSGSTGSPKLVRLSHQNLRANAEAIADYLQLRADDLAATTLPPHYCYGLSVLHSHLHHGAAVLLTDNSVVDPCLWEAVRTHGVTSFAGVPHTFEMLERIDFSSLDLPQLRQVTQAGGRLDPDQVRKYAELGRAKGFDFVVMYGATEATARMAWLPPDLAAEHPDAIGVPIPGGRFEIRPAEGHAEGAGELVFHGPNVMMGYATGPEDLSLGHTLTELHTGDLARVGDDGLYRIVGRQSRFTKIFGLRIDLDDAERAFADHGIVARCADGGDRLVVGTTDPTPDVADRIVQVARAAWGLPASVVVPVVVDEFPRLANGKLDLPTLVTLASSRPNAPDAADPPDPEASVEDRIRSTYAVVLRHPSVSASESFASLGGDSLSYVETSLRLEEILGHLPTAWHLLPISELAELSRSPVAGTKRWRSIETSVLLRALAIVAIVGTHGNLFTLLGGAHLLLGISGFNFARFQPHGTPAQQVRSRLASMARIAVPAVLWIGAVTLLFGTYPVRSVFLVNGLLGPPGWSEPAWHFWFLEALLAIVLVLTLLVCLPAWRRLDARWPFWLPMALVAVGLVTRYELWEPRGGDDIHRAHMLVWLFAIGWAIARVTLPWQRWLVTAVVIGAVPGFFDNLERDAFVAVGLLLVLWVPHVRVPAVVATTAGVLATASLHIYLTHWQIYPHLEDRVPLAALLASLAVGVAVSTLVQRVGALALRGQRTTVSSTGSSTGPGPLTSPTDTRVPTG